MPSSQAAAAERRNDRMIAHEPPKLKTTLKTPPKQATNPLQFVKVGPCSLYRTAQEQLQKVQEVKKIKQEVRDDPEDWQSNLDNWKSSRRKRQEHIIERVVEVKKLELEEHDRQRRRSKTFSEMMEERGNRGRKLSISLAMYHEEDANDLSDLGIGTSSGKSSVSGDTHDDTHSVLSDRDSEIEKNHSDLENPMHENLNNETRAAGTTTTTATTTTTTTTTTIPASTTATNNANKKASFNNGFHNHNHNSHQQQEYDSATTATTSSPEPEEYTYEGAIRGYVSRVSQNIPRRSLAQLDAKLESASKLNATDDKSTALNAPHVPVVKIDILKRREIFEKASQKQENNNKCTSNNNNNNNNNSANRLSGDFTSTKSIKERLSNLEKQNMEQYGSSKSLNRLSGDMSSIRERLSHLEKQTTERENKNLSMQNSTASSVVGHHHKLNNSEEFEVRPLRERLSTLEKYSSSDESSTTGTTALESRQHNGDLTARTIKDRLNALETVRNKEVDKRTGGSNNKHPLCFREHQETRNADASTPSERSSSPDSEYRVTRGATFHRSLDSLDADASSGPDTFERVQSLEELDYTRRYHPTSSSSAELLNDTDREDSGIHTADASCSVSQADENVDDDIHVHDKDPSSLALTKIQESLHEASTNSSAKTDEPLAEAPQNSEQATFTSPTDTVVVNKEQIIVERPEETPVSSVDEEAKNEEEEEEEEEQEVAIVTMNTPEPVVASSKETNLQQSNGNESEEILKTTSTPLNNNNMSNNNDNSNNINNHVVERPSNLSLGKMDAPFVIATDYLSPISPVSKPILPLTLSCDEEIITGLSFPLGPPTSGEPPKEKPPPPPTDISDEENQPVEPLKRLNSTRRIKKELRTRRSDFLGIEGFNDDDLERELSLTKPPDMAAILAEERRIEQLHRRSYDTDSNYEQDSSHERDSGVELGHVEDWTKQPDSPDMSQHSRQSSEPFGASVTSSEEDEITKKEREIIEVLEKEEQWRFGDNRDLHSDIGEKLAHKLRELEEEKMQLERARAQEVDMRHQEETLRKNEDNIRKQEETIRKQHQEEMTKQQEVLRESEAKRAEEKRKLQQQKEEEEESLRLQAEKLRIQSELEEKERRAAEIRRQEELRIQAMESHIREQESKALMGSGLSNHEDEYASREVLRVKRELLQLEQEELKRQRSNLAYREQKQQQLAEHLQEQWKSLQDVTHTPVGAVQQSCKHNKMPLNYRSSMPNLQMQEGQQRKKPPPPPIPPAKPLRLLERQRDVTIRNSRIPSADSIPQQVDSSLRHSVSAIALSSHAGQQMSRQTLQALSAVPRPRIVQGDQWVQRRKSDVPRGAQDFNYQHWLIQEAEQRRINEKNQRSPVRKSQQQHVTGTSVPFVASPSRPDSKPLPDSVIQTLTQRVQNRAQEKPLTPKRRIELSASQEHIGSMQHQVTHQHVFQKPQLPPGVNNTESQEKMLSVSGKKKCSHCGDELGRGAAMIIESLRLFYHMECFKCCVCHVRLGDGLMGTDVRVRNHKLHCHNCYSSDDGVKFSCV